MHGTTNIIVSSELDHGSRFRTFYLKKMYKLDCTFESEPDAYHLLIVCWILFFL